MQMKIAMVTRANQWIAIFMNTNAAIQISSSPTLCTKTVSYRRPLIPILQFKMSPLFNMQLLPYGCKWTSFLCTHQISI